MGWIDQALDNSLSQTLIINDHNNIIFISYNNSKNDNKILHYCGVINKHCK